MFKARSGRIADPNDRHFLKTSDCDEMIIGTAGHIDHGKTSLVKWLTGVDTDRLPEEKKRGITIDLGFAYTQGNNHEVLGFVDVPGHEKFVHTMVAGAVGIDHGLLVIAGDDGVMPQTIEHLRILELLGVKTLCVAITKIDKVDQQQLNQVQEEIEQLLYRTVYSSAKIFPVSNLSKEGLDVLKEYLLTLTLQDKSQNSFFRLAIDRVFVSKGMGVTITGAVHSGSIQTGDQLVIMPDQLPVKVRSIHAQNQLVDIASIGSRCGIVLTGVDLEQVKRGQWLVGRELTQVVERFDACITMPLDVHQKIRDGEMLLLHHGTNYTSVRTILLNQKEVLPGQTALAQLVLQKSLSMCWSDRFILRDMSARYTLAGGKVLDISPPQRGRKSEERLDFLTLLMGDNPYQVFQRLIASSAAPISIDFWSKAMNESMITLKKLAQEIHAHEIVFAKEIFFIHRALLEKIQNRIIEHVQASNQSVGIDQLRALFKPRVDTTLMKILLTELVAVKKLFLIGSKYVISNQGLVFSAQEKIIWDKVVLILLRDSFNPSPIKNVALEMGMPESLLQLVYSKAIAQELLIYVGNHVYYPFQTMKQIAKIMQNQFEKNQQITVVDLKNELQIGRNRVVLLIETFDKIGFTYRIIRKNPKGDLIGDFRIIKNPKIFFAD
jgi:selenocysteine-specific elongation factor